jgi:hypothetical protein
LQGNRKICPKGVVDVLRRSKVDTMINLLDLVGYSCEFSIDRYENLNSLAISVVVSEEYLLSQLLK